MKRLLLCFILVLSVSNCVKPKKTTNTLKEFGKNNVEYLTSEIPVWLKQFDVPGISVAVIENGEIVWNKVFGLQSPRMAADEKTLFLSASIAKPMTAEVFLRLAAIGKVTLDEPMADYWLDPDIAEDESAKLLTPRHVLTHQTGFKNWRRMTDGKLRFEWTPGTKMGYSGEGFRYLVRFIEKKLGKPFNDIAQEVLFSPEGMQDASFVYQEWCADHMAWPYFPDGVWREPLKVENAFGAGGLRITTKDYAKFLLSIMNDKKVTDALRQEQFTIALNQYEHCTKSATTPTACPQNIGFGLGWYIYEFEDEKVIGHTGANMAEKTLAVFSPETKKGLVLMSNGSNGNQVIYKIAEAVGINKNFITIEKPKK